MLQIQATYEQENGVDWPSLRLFYLKTIQTNFIYCTGELVVELTGPKQI